MILNWLRTDSDVEINMCTIWLVGPQKSAAFTYAPYCTIYVHLSKPHTNISGNHFYISDLSNSNIKDHPSVIFWNLEFIPSLSSGLCCFSFWAPCISLTATLSPSDAGPDRVHQAPPTHPTNTKDFLNLGQLIYIWDSMSMRGLFGHPCLFVCSTSREIWTYPSGPASGKYCRVFFFYTILHKCRFVHWVCGLDDRN